MQNKLERMVLGALLCEEDHDKQMQAICDLDYPQMFTNPVYEEILGAMSRIILSRKDLNQVNLHLALQNTVIDPKTITSLITEVSLEAFSSVRLSQWIIQLKENKFKKDITKEIKLSLDIISNDDFSEDPELEKNKLIAKLSGMTLGDNAEFISHKEFKDKIREQLGSGNEIEGYSWGLLELNNFTSGIVRPRVYVIGGLKKAGKTRFIIFTMKKLYIQEVPTAFMSMEMPGYECTKLLHASFTGMNDLRFRSGSTLGHTERLMFEDVNLNEELLGVECKSGLDKIQVVSRIRKYAKMGYKVIFIDYLQRIKHNRNNQANELEDISISIADAARQNNVAVILLSQLNVTGEHEAPNIGMLKGSGGIGESADSIILFDNLYRRSKDPQDKGYFELYLEQRYGDSGIIRLTGDLGSCSFGDLTNTKEEDQI